ncbi:MAG: signal peptidase II [Actinomycetota bacterium]
MTSAADYDATMAAGETEPALPSNRTRRVGLFALAAVVALSADLISKFAVVSILSDRGPVRVLGGALYLVQTRNSGAAFSVGTGATVVLTVVALAVVAVILRTARGLYSPGWAIALGLVLGGAVGNLVDRIFRAPGLGRGHVVDWIRVFAADGHIWPTFNIADSSIVCGAVLAGILALRGVDLDGSRSGRTSLPADPAR